MGITLFKRNHLLSVKRRQPGIISAFEKVWGTDDLIASFDGMNVSLPVNAENGRTDIPKSKAWPRA